MAKRRKPPPEVSEKWVTAVGVISRKLAKRRQLVHEAENELREAVCAAFAEGVLSTELTKVTGLSGSRLFQMKFAERDAQRKAALEALAPKP